jgi:hypothetical protein
MRGCNKSYPLAIPQINPHRRLSGLSDDQLIPCQPRITTTVGTGTKHPIHAGRPIPNLETIFEGRASDLMRMISAAHQRWSATACSWEIGATAGKRNHVIFDIAWAGALAVAS